MKRYIFVFATTFLLFGCSTPRFYSEITSTFPPGKKDDFISKSSSLEPLRIVLNHLQNELLSTEHIIVHYAPYPDWDSPQFSGVVYIPEHQNYYYYENTKDNPRDLKVSMSYPHPNDNYYKFVIDNYLEGRIEYLQRLGEVSNLSGITSSEVIYDINLTTNKYERFVFRDFLFMDGKPTKDVNTN